MGLLYKFSIRLLYFTIFIVILVLPDLPPHTTFPFLPFEILPPRQLKETLKPNLYLDHAERLLNEQIYGPECLISRKDEIYMGVHGGDVIKVFDNKVTHITKLGLSCEDIVEESICGRPLGLAFDIDNDGLIIADAYYGIWHLNLTSGVKTQIVSRNEVLPGKEHNRKAKFFNSVTVDKNGNIYWTDSSSDFLLQDLVYISFANPSGRVFKYDRKQKQNFVLMDNLYFPNGLALSPDEEFLVVAETGSMTLSKYYLKGEKAGKSDVLIDGLPGLPDNLTPDSEGIWVPLVMSVDGDHPNGFAIFSQFPLLRLFLTRFLFLLESVFQLINSVFSNRISQRFVHFIGHGESLKLLSPKRSTIIRLDWNGNIVDSFHGYDGSVGAVSHVLPFKNVLLLGSPFNHFLARVELPNATNRVRIRNIRHSTIELDSSGYTKEDKKVVSLKAEKKSKPSLKQSTSQIKDSKLEQPSLGTNTKDQPAPVNEEIKVDTIYPKPEKLKVINKEGKHMEL